MRIWVDADACPRPVKEMLYRAAERVQVELVLVANMPLVVPRRRLVRMITVGQGFDVADEYIAEQVEPGDVVITADIPLAAKAVENGAVVIDPRGDIIDKSNASSRLTMRDFMEQQREAGELLGGPKPYGDKDKRKFAASLDKILARRAPPS